MYLVYLRLKRQESEEAEVTSYMTKKQLQEMKKEVQDGVAKYEFANMVWNIKEFYYVKMNEMSKTIN